MFGLMFGVYLRVHPWIQVDLRNYLYIPNSSIFLQRSARHSGPTSFSTYLSYTPLHGLPTAVAIHAIDGMHYYNSLLSCHRPVRPSHLHHTSDSDRWQFVENFNQFM